MTPDQVWTRRTRARHPSHLRPVQGRPGRSASRDSWSRHAALDGDRRRANRDPSGPAPVKIPAAPGVLVGSRHTGRGAGRGAGRRANLHLHPCQPPVRPHWPRPILGVSPAACAMRWCSQSARGCATGVAAATPKMRAAPKEGSPPGTHRPSLLRRPGGTAPGPDNRRPVPPPPDWHARRQRRIGRVPNGD